MPLFLAVYMMKADNVVRFRAMPKADQDAVDNAGLPQWAEWEKRNAQSIVSKGGMVGKTTRVTASGIAPASNDICGYLVVRSETAGAAAALFADHPHFNTFPGDGVDIMPFVTEPEF